MFLGRSQAAAGPVGGRFRIDAGLGIGNRLVESRPRREAWPEIWGRGAPRDGETRAWSPARSSYARYPAIRPAGAGEEQCATRWPRPSLWMQGDGR